MTAIQILDGFIATRVEVWADSDRLRYRSLEPLSPERLNML